MNTMEKEAVQVYSKVSSMRIAFFKIIKTIIFISIISVFSFVGLSYLGKPFDMSGIVALIGILATVAFGGKAVQSFSENPTAEKIMGVVNTAIPPVKDDSSTDRKE